MLNYNTGQISKLYRKSMKYSCAQSGRHIPNVLQLFGVFRTLRSAERNSNIHSGSGVGGAIGTRHDCVFFSETVSI